MTVRGHIIGPGGYLQGDGTRFVLALIDLDDAAPEAELFDLDFLGHGVSIDPQNLGQAAVFEKKGPGACHVDLAAREVLRPITTAANRHFYGHGAYSHDGALLYATESVLDDDLRGLLVVRDAATLEVLGELPTFGTAPHDCRLLDDGRTMVVANGGGHIQGGAMPSVSYVDVVDETLLDRVEMPDPRFNAGHLARTEAGDLAVVSAPRDGLPNLSRQLGAVTLVPKGKPPVTMSKPGSVTGAMLGEALSVAIHEPSGTVMATHPEGNMVSTWSLVEGAHVGRFDDFTEPRGVCLTLDGKLFVVSHRIGKSVALSLVDAESLELLELGLVNPSYTSGSHIIAHQLPA